jgi:hypothetical protein
MLFCHHIGDANAPMPSRDMIATSLEVIRVQTPHDLTHCTHTKCSTCTADLRHSRADAYAACEFEKRSMFLEKQDEGRSPASRLIQTGELRPVRLLELWKTKASFFEN